MKIKNGNFRKKELIRIILAGMFFTAGVSHFLFHELFTDVIPKFLPLRPFLNQLVGVIEIVLGVLYYSSFKKIAYYLTFNLLVIYIWAHVAFIQTGSCAADFCISPWIAWVRLIIVHPILLYSNYYLIRND